MASAMDYRESPAIRKPTLLDLNVDERSVLAEEARLGYQRSLGVRGSGPIPLGLSVFRGDELGDQGSDQLGALVAGQTQGAEVDVDDATGTGIGQNDRIVGLVGQDAIPCFTVQEIGDR
jgi:hypothetical protein